MGQIIEIIGERELQVASVRHCILNTPWGSIRQENGDIFPWSSIAKPQSFLTSESQNSQYAVQIIEKAFICFNNNYGNHYHQLREWCLSIFIYYHHGFHDQGYKLILPSNALGIDYRKNEALNYTLAFLDLVDSTIYVEPGQHIKIGSCLYPIVLSGYGYTECTDFTAQCFTNLSDYIIAQAGFPVLDAAQHGTSIYISRLDSTKRRIVNEAQLIEALLSKHQFQIVSFSSLQLAAQIACIRLSNVIVAPHGAALANLLFKPSGSCRIIEIMPEGYVHPFFSCISNTKLFTHDQIIASKQFCGGDVHNSKYLVDTAEVLRLL